MLKELQIKKFSELTIINAKKLISFAESVINSQNHKVFFEKCYEIFGITHESLTRAFLDYNLDINKPEGNEIYNSIENRAVLHIHNLIPDSWHQQRQSVVTKMLFDISPKNIADIGFGVPSNYVKDYVLKTKGTFLTLADKFPEAFSFAKLLCKYWSENYSSSVTFKETDFNTLDYVGDFDCYILQDSIEHAILPKQFFGNYVKKAPVGAYFLISLPIGPIFPRHFIAWDTDDEALFWTQEFGLEIISKESVYVNAKVDLFAEQLNNTYHDIYFLARKKHGF